MKRPSPALRLVLGQLDAWWQAGRARLPRLGAVPIQELHLELTHRCDMRCVMCHHWAWSKAAHKELAPKDIFSWIDGSRRLREVRSIVLTGGEAWLHPQGAEIAAGLRQRFPQASLGVLSHLSDAAMARKRLREFARCGLSDVWLGTSLDGVGAVHDRMRGRPGAFAGLVGTLDMLRQEFPEVKVTVNSTITPDNVSGLWPAYQFARERGLGFGAQFVVEHKGLPAPRDFSWDRARRQAAADAILQVMEDICSRENALERIAFGDPRAAQGLWASLLYWQHLRAGGGAGPGLKGECQAGSRYVMVDPGGDVFFCPVRKHERIGNLGEHGLDSVWASGRAQKFRQGVGRCGYRCWLNCIAYPFLDRVLEAAWSDDIRAEPAQP
ncbi:MAG: radical SAM protein [Elusimicrobiota bacterium]|jgi:MoaA/NifB/PqqE/SkfB family radical SAM enzyme